MPADTGWLVSKSCTDYSSTQGTWPGKMLYQKEDFWYVTPWLGFERLNQFFVLTISLLLLHCRLHHTDVPARPRSETPWAGVEREQHGPWLGAWWGAVVPAVWCPLQDSHPAPGPHGHACQPGRPHGTWPHQQQQQHFNGHSFHSHPRVQPCSHCGPAGDWLL